MYIQHNMVITLVPRSLISHLCENVREPLARCLGSVAWHPVQKLQRNSISQAVIACVCGCVRPRLPCGWLTVNCRICDFYK